MAAIFLSYRRKDTSGHAELIYQHLVKEFGQDKIAKDVNAFAVGNDFRKEMELKLADCKVVLAIIGSRWLEQFEVQARGAEPDYLLKELEIATRAGIPIVPVFVEGAKMPRAEELLPSIRDLAYQNGIEVHEPPHTTACLNLLVERLCQAFPELCKGTSTRHHSIHRGRLAVAVATLVVLALFIWREIWPPSRPSGSAVGALLYNECWVTYDPVLSLDQQRAPIYKADREAIQKELAIIRKVGFSGVVTSGANGILAEIPAMARKYKLHVIMGIWNPADPVELRRAIAQASNVDAYCVGASGLPSRYGKEELVAAVNLLRRRTGRPVAISEYVSAYEDQSLLELSDWLFPDTHLTLKDRDDIPATSANIDRDLKRIESDAHQMAQLARKSSMPLMFHHVAYPYKDITGASREVQATFFRRLMERLLDRRLSDATKVGIVAQSSFDTPWKQQFPFLAWETSAGLIECSAMDAFSTTLGADQASYRLTAAGEAILEHFPHLRANLGKESP